MSQEIVVRNFSSKDLKAVQAILFRYSSPTGRIWSEDMVEENGEKMKLDDYLSQFSELNSLYQLVRQDFTTRGLVHHNCHHIHRDFARAVIIGETEKANIKIFCEIQLKNVLSFLLFSLSKLTKLSFRS